MADEASVDRPVGAQPPASERAVASTDERLSLRRQPQRLEQAVRELGVPVTVARELDEADAVVTLRNYYRRSRPRCATPSRTGADLRARTILQMENMLASLFDLEVNRRRRARDGGGDRAGAGLRSPGRLAPQNAYVRRLQHQMAERNALMSRSRGSEPNRRVELIPDDGAAGGERASRTDRPARDPRPRGAGARRALRPPAGVSPPPPERGRFITLEGPEGSGKTTAARHLGAWLQGARGAGHRDAGAWRHAPRRRGPPDRAPHARDERRPRPRADALLYAAGRAQHVERVIRPALERGAWVVCARYLDSSLAYQAPAGNDPSAMRRLQEFATGGLLPDLTLLLDVPVDVGLARTRRRAEWNRFEDTEGAAFFERVRRAYLDLAAAEPGRFEVIDGLAQSRCGRGHPHRRRAPASGVTRGMRSSAASL